AAGRAGRFARPPRFDSATVGVTVTPAPGVGKPLFWGPTSQHRAPGDPDAPPSATRPEESVPMRHRFAAPASLLLSAAPLAAAARADEGRRTFDTLPLARLQQGYGFTPGRDWLEHVQRSCVNFGGGSGAFVSADGLVLTNHHVALGQLQKMS